MRRISLWIAQWRSFIHAMAHYAMGSEHWQVEQEQFGEITDVYCRTCGFIFYKTRIPLGLSQEDKK